MNLDTPDIDRAARDIAENAYIAYCRQATMPPEPLAEQTVLARLVEAARPLMAGRQDGEIAAALNGALDTWEQLDPKVRGPRVASVNLLDATVTMGPA